MSSSPATSSNAQKWTRSMFRIPAMDCPSEESLIRLSLAGVKSVERLDFDLAERSLYVTYRGDVAPIKDRLEALDLGAVLEESEAIDATIPVVEGSDVSAAQRRTLWVLLGINAAMFVVEIIVGWIAQSTGLLADGLDMLADATVYGLSLYVVGRSASSQLRAAHISGWSQAIPAVGALEEVVRRFIWGSQPEPGLMMAVSGLALVANVVCLGLIYRQREEGAHMKASWIFSTNDVIANLGVLTAGALVAATGSRLPDLVIGAIVAAVVLWGARRILRMR